MLVRQVRYWAWEKRNPDKPWLCPGTVAFCESNLSRTMRGLEFGSGRSTRWFASRLGHLTSVEHAHTWYEQVAQTLSAEGVRNVDYRFVPLDHPEAEPERFEYVPTPAYVAVVDRFSDKSLDFVLVDGHYRTHCIRHAVPKVATGGYLVVDDVNMWPSHYALPIPDDWRIADDSTNGIKRCVVWQAV